MKRSRLNRVSKRPSRTAELKADASWARNVLAMTGNKCAYCGRHGCQAAHIIPRRFKNFRHHTDNGLPLCPDCHRWADNEGQREFHAWLAYAWPKCLALWRRRHEPPDREEVRMRIAFLNTQILSTGLER